MAGWRSDPRVRAVVVLLATLVGMALTARLGWWQLDRAAQKEALQQSIDSRAKLPELEPSALPRSAPEAVAQHYRPVRLTGEWHHAATVFLDNRQMNGRPGFFVLTPLRLGPGDAVVVQRGWVPRDAQERTRLPDVRAPAGPVVVVGHLAPPPGRLWDFGPAASAPRSTIRQNLDLAAFSREIGMPLRPWTVLEADAPGTDADGLLRQWSRPAADVHKHYGYAFQWFGLCALMAGLYVWFQLLRPRFARRDA